MMNCPYCAVQNLITATVCASCGSPLTGAPFQALAIGSSLQNGKYQIIKPLAQGGFGITYVARHTALNQTVTIKELCLQGSMRVRNTLQPPTTQLGTWQQAVSSFSLEARTLASFNHPGIVKVQDVFEENNTAYFVMEYLQGQTLGEKLRASVFNEAQTLTLARQICAALREVHAHGLLHRDIKPDNIFLETTRGAVLIDFGSARTFTGKTVQHTQMLTPGFAPLEQYSATGKFGPYTDIYSFAATLYTALTGYQPPDAVSRANHQALIFPAHISSIWRDLIDCSMRFNINERPQNIDEFLAALPTTPGVNLPLPSQAIPTPFGAMPAGTGSKTLPGTAILSPTQKRSGFLFWLLIIPVLAVAGFFGFKQFGQSLGQKTPEPISAWQASRIEVATDALNVRNDADLSASIVQSGGQPLHVVHNEQLQVSATRNGWYKVSVQGISGWVSARMSIPLEPKVSEDRVKTLLQDLENKDTVTLEAGIYELNDVLELSRGVEVIGEGWQNTILVSRARGQSLKYTGKGALKLRDLTIAHIGAAPAAVAIIHSGLLELNNVRIIGGSDSSDWQGDEGDGLVIRGDTTAKINNSFFVGNAWRGLSIRDTTKVSMKNSVSRANIGSGVLVSDQAKPSFENNQIDGNGLMGVKIVNKSSVILKDNTISDNQKGAFGFYDTSGGQVSGNTCQNNGKPNVYSDPSVLVQFVRNVGCDPIVASSASITATPSKTLPVSPNVPANFSGVKFFAPENRNQFLAFNKELNLWNTRLDRNRNVNFLNTAQDQYHQARARAYQTYSWGVRWCNPSFSQLQIELQKIELRIEADGVGISNAQVYGCVLRLGMSSGNSRKRLKPRIIKRNNIPC